MFFAVCVVVVVMTVCVKENKRNEVAALQYTSWLSLVRSNDEKDDGDNDDDNNDDDGGAG